MFFLTSWFFLDSRTDTDLLGSVSHYFDLFLLNGSLLLRFVMLSVRAFLESSGLHLWVLFA